MKGKISMRMPDDYTYMDYNEITFSGGSDDKVTDAFMGCAGCGVGILIPASLCSRHRYDLYDTMQKQLEEHNYAGYNETNRKYQRYDKATKALGTIGGACMVASIGLALTMMIRDQFVDH